MDEQLNRLEALLATIREGMAAKRDPSREPWYNNAIGTIMDNVEAYLAAIKNVAATGSPADKVKAACRVSGMRKGVSDLGVLDPKGDATLIETVDEADTLATRVCLSG